MEKKYLKANDGEYCHNCYFHIRENDPHTKIINTGGDAVLSVSDDAVRAQLNGYAIIPYEEFIRLKKLDDPTFFDNMNLHELERDIKNCDEIMFPDL